MHQNEKWQVYAANGNPIAGEWWDAALDNPEKTDSPSIVGVSVTVLYRFSEAGVLELLWQRRSDQIDRYPGDWDISAGGHINFGEATTAGAVRECREEIGAEITEDELHFVTMRPFNRNRFCWIYAVDFTGRSDAFHFDDHEVSEVRWVPFADTEAFRTEYGKAPLKRDSLTFDMLAAWFEMQGII